MQYANFELYLHAAIVVLLGGEKKVELPLRWLLGRSPVALGRAAEAIPSPVLPPPVQDNPPCKEENWFRTKAFRNRAFLTSQLWCFSKLQVRSLYGVISCQLTAWASSKTTVSTPLRRAVFILLLTNASKDREQFSFRTKVSDTYTKYIVWQARNRSIICARNQRPHNCWTLWGFPAVLVTLWVLVQLHLKVWSIIVKYKTFNRLLCIFYFSFMQVNVSESICCL